MTDRHLLAKERAACEALPILDTGKLASHFTEEKEIEWDRTWEESGIYQYDPNSSSEVYCTDMPLGKNGNHHSNTKQKISYFDATLESSFSHYFVLYIIYVDPMFV